MECALYQMYKNKLLLLLLLLLLTLIYTVNLLVLLAPFSHTSDNETVKTKVFSPRGFPTAYFLVPGVERAENIVSRHSEKDSSKQIRFLCDYNFVGWCNFIINLHKQQQDIDSLSSKGWFIIISHQALLCLFCRRGNEHLQHACLLHKLAITTLVVVVPLADFTTL